MRRRDLIAALLSAALATPARAQKQPRIAILHSGFPNRTPIHLLFEALRALGYENDRTAAIDLLGAEGDADRLDALVAQLAAQKPDVIIALTSPAVLALKRAGLTTPVVFLFVSDPVALGVVESLARPGANFTGVTFSEAELGGKRLELLVDALPGTKRVAVLWSPSFAENAAILESIRGSAVARGIEIFSRELRGVEDLPSAFDDAARAGAPAVVFMTDNAMFAHGKEVAALALAHHLPSVHTFVNEVRPDVLWPRWQGELSACRRLGRSDSQGRAPGRPAGRGTDTVHSGCQHDDGKGARHRAATRDHAARR